MTRNATTPFALFGWICLALPPTLLMCVSALGFLSIVGRRRKRCERLAA